MRWGRCRVAAAVAAVTGLLASCTPVPTRSPDVVWQQVPLPGGAWPSVLAVAGGRLLVGGFDPTAAGPALAGLDPAGQVEPVALHPWQGYAQAADLVSLSPSGGSLLALGVARGGAHGYERWTTWDGTLTEGIRDHQQDFMTFGGHEAGPLLGLVRPGGVPVIVGSRGGDSGFQASLWTSRGTTWSRLPTTDPQLRSGADRVLVFRSTATSGETIAIAGAEIGLAGGVLQSPVLWLGSVAGPWRTVSLQVPDELATATGLAQAASIACGAEATSPCWVAGWVRGRPVAWEVDVAAGTATATVLPGTGGSGTDPSIAVGLLDAVPVVFTNADQPLLTWRCGDGWQAAPAPPGQVVAVATVGSRVYAAAGDDDGRRLWQADLDTTAC